MGFSFTSILGKLRRNVVSLGILLLAILMTLCGIIIRWYYMRQTHISPDVADMLPLIQQACDTFASGSNPYEKVYEMPWELPLTFWPGMWLPYFPFRQAGVDIRWLHLCVIAVIGVFFFGQMLRSKLLVNGRHRRGLLAGGTGLFLLLFSSEPVFFTSIGHTAPQWAWTVLLATAILSRRPYVTAIALGILLSSRQTTVVLVPLVIIYCTRHRVVYWEHWNSVFLPELHICSSVGHFFWKRRISF